MKARAILKQSLAALAANKGRSLLTVLGIIIGIASVIALVSLGAGVRASIASQVTALGANNLIISPGGGIGRGDFGGGAARPGSGSGNLPGHSQGPAIGGAASSLTAEDLAILEDKARHPRIDLVSGQISGSEILATLQGDQRYSVLGTSASYFGIQNLSSASGALLSREDVEGGARVAVLGHQVAVDIFGGSEAALGSAVRIAGAAYRVVGVLAPAAESRLANPNSQIFVPHTAASKDFGVRNFDMILVRVASPEDIEPARQEIKASLLASHGISDERLADFGVSSSADLLSLVNTITGTLTSLLAAIAAISLLVGGIGIMNIMLVSVTERTREIGLRKAVGASESDILAQFILEAVC
jgi:putative ABC transport system permease protein